MKQPAVAGTKVGYSIRPELRAHIEGICHEQGLGKAALAYLWGSIDDGPSRKVKSQGSNVIVNFHSRKMGLQLMLESRTGELPCAMLLEHDDTVVAFFAQPRTVDLMLVDDAGKTVGRTVYTPDFLIVHRDRIEIREVRDEDWIIKKSLDKCGHTYRDASTGRWHYRPAEQYFSGLGFRYEYISNQSLPQELVANMRFLDGHMAADRAPLDAKRMAELADAVQQARRLSLYELFERGFTADEIYPAIADRTIYFDLQHERLTNSQDLVVYASETLARVARIERIARQEPPLPLPGTLQLEPGTRLTIDGQSYTVSHFGREDTLLRDSAGIITSRRTSDIVRAHERGHITGGEAPRGRGGSDLFEVSQPAYARALKRLDAVRSGNRGEFSERSFARFRAATLGAETDLEMLTRLIDNADRRGNRTRRMSDVNRDLIELAVRDYYDTPQCRAYKGAWDKYVGLCAARSEEDGIEIRPVSYPTFTKEAEALTDIEARLGKRAAYAKEPIYTSLEDNLNVRGEYPHEVCHVDHTTANMALVSPNGVDLGKPTLSVAVDGCTAHPRAQYLSFDAPSARQVLMVLRDYVRRHKRLPRKLVVDNGPEFRGEELKQFCNIYGITLIHRPPAKARHGSIIERLLGATEDEVFKELEGYTGILKKDARSVTKSVDPFRRACWTLPALYAVTEWYLFEERPGRIHPVLGMTPNDFEAQRLIETGTRAVRTVHYNSDLLLMTSPHAGRKLHVVDPQRGVWVGGTWFNHPEFAGLGCKEKAELRIEPWLRSVVYVYVNKHWVTAIGRFPTWVGQRTSREGDLALREGAKRATARAQRSSVSPDKRTNRQHAWRPEDFDERIHLRQEETRYTAERLSMTLATPEAEQVAADLRSRPSHDDQPTYLLPTAPSAPPAPRVSPPAPVEHAVGGPPNSRPSEPPPAPVPTLIDVSPPVPALAATPAEAKPTSPSPPKDRQPPAPKPTPPRDSAISRLGQFH